jgi:hypothetical protein
MDEALFAHILASAQALGFDPGRLQKTRQDAPASPAP